MERKDYFLFSHTPLISSSLILKYTKLEVIKNVLLPKMYIIGCLFKAPVVPDSCLPIGATKEDGSTTLLPVQPS